ncbi:MAG TPA: hypothetical protein VKQ72_08360, partial [Aggregatilineales bacterium]|nr:hypothetical protein [Aggregatilineales bacterium]
TTADLQRFVFTNSQKHPPDVWLGENIYEGDALHRIPTSCSIRRLTELNPLHQDMLEIVPTQRMRYESSDGWQIDALFTPPLSQKNGTPPPLIVNVHGGPTGAWTDDWDNYRSQLLAADG